MPRGQSLAGYAGSHPPKDSSENGQHPNGVRASPSVRRQQMRWERTNPTTAQPAPHSLIVVINRQLPSRMKHRRPISESITLGHHCHKPIAACDAPTAGDDGGHALSLK
jgi:hypothetical protein